jgi:hypothetical protein
MSMRPAGTPAKCGGGFEGHHQNPRTGRCIECHSARNQRALLRKQQAAQQAAQNINSQPPTFRK